MQFQPKEGIVGINSVAQADSDIRRVGEEYVEGIEVPNETRKFKIDYITTTDRPQGVPGEGERR